MTVRYLIILLLFVTMLAGGFQLGRISSQFDALGPLTEVRFALFFLLIPTMAVFWISKKRSVSLSRVHRWVLVVAAFHGYMAYSAFWSPDPMAALDSILSVLALGAILLFTPTLFGPSPERHIERYFKLLLWGAFIFALAALFLSGEAWGDPGREIAREGRGRIAAFWGGPNTFARLVGAGCILAIYFSIRTGRKKWLVLLPILALAGFLSGSRGGLLGFVIVSLPVAFVFVRFKDGKRGRKNLFPFLAVTIGLTALLFSTPFARGHVADIFDRQFNNRLFQEFYWGGRELSYPAAWQLFKDYPLVGVGLDGYRQGGFPLEYPHNLILDIATSGGLVGLALFSLAMIQLIPRWSQPRNLEHTVAFLLGTAFLIAAMFSGSFYDTRYMWLFFLFYMMPASSPKTSAKDPGNEADIERTNIAATAPSPAPRTFSHLGGSRYGDG